MWAPELNAGNFTFRLKSDKLRNLESTVAAGTIITTFKCSTATRTAANDLRCLNCRLTKPIITQTMVTEARSSLRLNVMRMRPKRLFNMLAFG